MTGKAWTPELDDWLREHYPHHPTAELAEQLGRTVGALHQRASRLGLHKTHDLVSRLCSESSSKPRRVSPASRRTQFRAGQQPRNTEPLGAESWTSNGYRVRKVAHHGKQHERWRPVHHLVWEEHYGEIPDGYIIAFRDGDQTNVSIQNLELISKAQRMHQNSVWRYPQPLAEAMRMLGQHRRRIREKEEQQA